MSNLHFLIQTIRVFTALFIITDSIGNLPFFISLTEGFTPPERRKAFSGAILTGAILLAFFGVAGSLIFNLFDFTLEDFKIAGGILLFIISIEVLLRGRMTFEHKEEVGIVPLGCPLLVGPGAITSILVMTQLYNFYAVIAGTLLCFLVVWIILNFSENIYKLLGRNGSLIITKISAIIIATIAVRFIKQGVEVFLRL